MLVSKIKPCMSKYIPLDGDTANGSLNQLWFLRSFSVTWITVAILELIHVYQSTDLTEGAVLSVQNHPAARPSPLVNLDNFVLIAGP